jgi:hypothetical protein
MKTNLLQATLNHVAGCEIEITVRSEHEFTFSFFGEDGARVLALKNFLKRGVFEADYDNELNETFIYYTL